jgi:hypothetical protein
LVVGLYAEGVARNRGIIPSWVTAVVDNAWMLLVVALFVLVSREVQRRALGTVTKERFVLRAGETWLFRTRFMSGQFHPRPEAFNPRPGLLQMLRGPLTAKGLLWVALTDKRFGFGLSFFYTWRIIDVTSISRVSEVHGRWPHSHALLIEYAFAGRTEGLVVSMKSAGGRRLGEAIRRLIGPQYYYAG